MRMNILCEWVSYYIKNLPENFLSVVYLFYDGWRGNGEVTNLPITFN